MQNDLITKINTDYHNFSKGQKLLANYILNNYEKAVFLTASKLGKIVGVSESTVVRFATELGFDGYPKLQKALEELVKSKLNSVQRMEVTYDRINQDNLLKTVLHSDAQKLRMTLEELDTNLFHEVVDTILKAKTIYIMGVRSSAPLAIFLGFYFNIIFEHVKLIQSNSASELYEQIYRIGKEDVMIAISFPRYSTNILKALDFAKSRGAEIITVTDGPNSPLTNYANHNLFARTDMASIVDSLVAPMSVLNALVVAICLKKQEEVVDTFESLEEIWRKYKIYNNFEEANTTSQTGMSEMGMSLKSGMSLKGMSPKSGQEEFNKNE